jgi:phosphoglycolate phosphatase-like HAD superfamily hydrolase
MSIATLPRLSPPPLRVATAQAYVFDIDGTLADGSHRIHHILRQPKDWLSYFSKLEDDSLILHVAEVCKCIAEVYDVVYVSGRPEEYREPTRRWMLRHHLPPGSLYMRPEGDRRNDDIVKIEILGRLREDGYEVLMWFEDRARCVRALRLAGVSVAHVADGEF